MLNLKITAKIEQKCIFNFKIHTKKAKIKTRKHIVCGLFLLLYPLCLFYIFNLFLHFLPFLPFLHFHAQKRDKIAKKAKQNFKFVCIVSVHLSHLVSISIGEDNWAAPQNACKGRIARKSMQRQKCKKGI